MLRTKEEINMSIAPAVLVIAGKEYHGYATDVRVNREASVYKYFYEMRHGDDDSYPCTIEESVRVNFFGTFLTDEEIPLLETDTSGTRYSNIDMDSDGFSSFGFVD